MGLTDYLKFVSNPIGTSLNAVTDFFGINSTLDKQINAADKNQDKEMAFNAEQAQLNRDFQREERLATQEFNSASAQIQRLLDAGVNPMTAFSNGYTSAESTPMTGVSASYSSGLAGSILTTSAQRQLVQAQIDNIAAQTENTKHSTVNMDKKTSAEIDKIYSDIGMNDYSKDIQERTFQFFASKTTAEVKVMNEQLNLLRNQSLEVLKNIDLKDAQIKDTLASAELKESQKGLVESQTQGQDLNNQLLNVQKQFSDITGVPIGSSEEQALFALWKSGKWNDVSDKIMLNSANSDSPVSKAAGYGRMSLLDIGAGIDSLIKSIGNIFTK